MLTPTAHEKLHAANRLARELHRTLLEIHSELLGYGEDFLANEVICARMSASDALSDIEDLIDNLPAPTAPDPDYQRAAQNGRMIDGNGRDVS